MREPWHHLGINVWNRHFFDALEARNGALALHEGIKLPLLVALYLVLCVFAMWARMTLQRTWRAWINAELLRRWLARSRFYKLELIPGDHTNPEHRINDDLRVATEMPVDLVTGFAGRHHRQRRPSLRARGVPRSQNQHRAPAGRIDHRR